MSVKGKKVAIFLEKTYEDNEFWYPYYRLKEAGAEVVAIAPKKDTYPSKHGAPAQADQAIDAVDASEFDALVIPGGYSPDHMRRNKKMVEFVSKMNDDGKPIAAICHGGWMLASAEVLKGRKVTSFIAIKDDLVHAGAEWIDQGCVKSDNIITSRMPDDLPVFCNAILEALD
jgi:protease I